MIQVCRMPVNVTDPKSLSTNPCTAFLDFLCQAFCSLSFQVEVVLLLVPSSTTTGCHWFPSTARLLGWFSESFALEGDASWCNHGGAGDVPIFLRWRKEARGPQMFFSFSKENMFPLNKEPGKAATE